MSGKKTKLIYQIILLSIGTFTVFYLNTKSKSNRDRFKTDFYPLIAHDPIINTKASDPNYLHSCIDLFKKIRNPNASLFFKPALKRPPDHLLDEFTMNGRMPIKRLWYINEVYSDSNSDKSSENFVFSIKHIKKQLRKIRKNAPLGYQDKDLNRIMHEYKSAFENKSMVVIGTQWPWIESIGIDLDVAHVLTLDYTRARYID